MVRLTWHTSCPSPQLADSWRRAARCLATVDALASLACVSQAENMCTPEFVNPGPDGGESECEAVRCTQPDVLADAVCGHVRGFAAPVLELRGSWHPCVAMEASKSGGSATSFVPNDVAAGGAAPRKEGGHSGPTLLLVTGPNMGGKSTLLRQVAVVVIMAQVRGGVHSLHM